MTYNENIATTIHGELMKRVIKRNKQAKRSNHKEQAPNSKHVLKLAKYWHRANAK